MKGLIPAIMIIYSLSTLVKPAIAQTWTPTSAPTNINWSAIASSADGSKLVAVAADSGFYRLKTP